MQVNYKSIIQFKYAQFWESWRKENKIVFIQWYGRNNSISLDMETVYYYYWIEQINAFIVLGIRTLVEEKPYK